MKKTIQEILEQELQRLKALSDSVGLELSDFKKLESLVKVHREFVGDSAPPSPDDPSQLSVEQLLSDIKS